MSGATPQAIIEALSAMKVEIPEGGKYEHITQEQGEEIARLFEGDYSLFRRLDEQPGAFGGYDEWHWKLRQARNGCELFFAILSADRAKGAYVELIHDDPKEEWKRPASWTTGAKRPRG